jgi:hypothetical protein
MLLLQGDYYRYHCFDNAGPLRARMWHAVCYTARTTRHSSRRISGTLSGM